MPRKRSSGDGALYEDKKRGLWKGVVDVGFWPDGRRRQKTVTARTQAAARIKLNSVRDEIREHGAPLDKRTTLSSYSQEWLDTVCRPKLKPSTLAQRESIIRTWIIPTIGTKAVATVRPPDVRAVASAVTAAGKSSSTARKVHDVLSMILESARRDGLAGKNVALDVDAPMLDDSPRLALSPAQAIEILKNAAAETNGTRWWAALLLGLRQGERLGATIDSLDLKNGLLTVEWTLEEVTSEHGCDGVCGKKRGSDCPARRYKIRPGMESRHLYGRLFLLRPKSGKTRTVPLVPALTEALKRHLLEYSDRPNPHNLIWRHDDGTPFLPHEDQSAWRDLLARSGVADRSITSHWARHTTATILMELGVDAKIIGEIVGHQSEAVTRRYQHVSSAAARDAMNRLGQRYSEALDS